MADQTDFKARIFRAVAMIPKGMTATYADVAELAGMERSAARAVGNAVHTNTDPEKVPCHRVVTSTGAMGDAYAFGGPAEQRRRLEAEGVKFSGERVNLSLSGVVFQSHPLSPFLPDNGRILFLGSFPPPLARWSMEFFYPNPQNDFWRIMGRLFYDDAACFERNDGARGFDKDRITEFCRTRGLGFFDTASRVCRLKGNASDEYLVITEPSPVCSMLEKMPRCRTVVTTGGKATEELGNILGEEMHLTVPEIGSKVDFAWGEKALRWWRMPSSSRAYPMSLEKKTETYGRVIRDCFGK